MKVRTYEENLEEVLRTGAGRRFLAQFITSGLQDSHLGHTPEETAFNLGVSSVARDMDRRLRVCNPDAWLLMHREMLEADKDEDTEVPRDA
jgi:hypothetical protein